MEEENTEQELPRDLKNELKSLLEEFTDNKTDPKRIEEAKERLEKITGKKVPSYHDIRREFEDNSAQDVADMQRNYRMSRRDEFLKNCDVNKDWTFANINDDGDIYYQSVVEGAKDWINRFDENEKGLILKDNDGERITASPGSLFWLYGNFGVGKSMLAGAMAHKFIEEKMREVLFMQWHNVYMMLLQNMSDNVEYFRFVNRLNTVDLLVLDEVAVDNTKLSEAQQRILGELLRSRKNLGKNTIIVSNAGPEQLESYVGTFCFESIKNYWPQFTFELKGMNRRRMVIGGYSNQVNDYLKKQH